jgi:5,10-methylene-tetrahydrofolate dehydrogenase/methenyl tetrahydrofolate cyclohydrolase
VGERKDSALYVRNKNAACRRTGIRSENFLFDESVSQVRTQMDTCGHMEDTTADCLFLYSSPWTGHCRAEGGGAQ